MCYIVTMHMGKATRIFRDDATGCLKCEFEFVYTSVFPYSAVYSAPSYFIVCCQFCAYFSVFFAVLLQRVDAYCVRALLGG